MTAVAERAPEAVAVRRLLAGGLVSGALLAVVVATALGAEEPVPGIELPGPVVAYGLPVLRVLLDLAAVAVVGLSLLPKLLGFDEPERTEPVMRRARPMAVSFAWAWALLALTVIVFQTAELNPGSVPTPGMIAEYVDNVGAGQGMLFSAACALAYAGIGLLAVRFGEKVPAELRILVALFGLLPIPVTGHAVDSVWHDPIMISMELHVMGSAAWTGGLLMVMLLVARDRGLLAEVLPRFSRLASLALAVVALSGLVNGLATIALTPGTALPGSLLTSEYGLLVVAKTASVALLVPLAAHIRFRLLPRVERQEATAVAAWAAAELTVMGLAYGVAVALTTATIS
ncbi:copper resistance D family protein [Planomonospora parontospora]|uniref:copper resistance D family protein n=1 Tax=Planomonospora parontospora TaxID=58119 RepID=UPI00166F9021|nr:CopD family protein [Planomonospora parontospora]GGL27424.1 copper resistance protein CopD [Planomonospora parontospora subsp. antibiotica]GII16520.1 copper resistance protein CopD [Planomonospora parontospora subsp. antibiotica]